MNQPYEPNQPYDPNRPYDPNQQGVRQPGYDAPQQWGPQPAYGRPPQGAQPWGPPPQKAGNGRLWALIGGAAALLVVVGVVLWLVLSGGGRSAEDTVTAFMEAAKHGDATAAKAVSCPAVDAKIGDDDKGSGLPSDVTYTVHDVEEHGDSATAIVTATAEGEKVDLSFKLKKNGDGDFEVCDYSLS
ncbi:nuclear transport factor 2 family protein [Cumulibacter manganitolerans]|uniref:hypothetical protein n=1 Tax=Cumulibacter manganitolerans TaxID=1884992 RepID=UPI0012982052|nr:hypothetical protein [Cumulibacter manganitolerans]